MSDQTQSETRGQSEVHALLPQAVELHLAGRLADAERLYRQIIVGNPHDFDAIHLLGVIALQEGRLEPARELITTALSTNPNSVIAQNNLGTVYLRLGRPEIARSHFARALTVDPDSLDALINLGSALQALARPREALVPLQRAYAINPGSAQACNLLGACLLDTGDAEAAVSVFEAGIRSEPQNASSLANLAIALSNSHDHPRAEEYAARALEIDPGLSMAYGALAAAQFEQGKIDAAITSYERAVALPDVSDKTLAAFANTLLACGRNAAAMEQLRRAIQLEPHNAMARWKLSMANCQAIYRNEADVPAARDAFARSLTELSDWYKRDPVSHAWGAVAANQPFYLAYQAVNNKEILSQYGRVCVEWMSSLSCAKVTAPARAPGAKMRIGVASAHIRDHSVWNAITKGWVQHLDKDKFEIYLFHLSHSSDAETEWAKKAATHFDGQAQGLESWIETIQNAQLDALIYPEIGMDPLTTQLASSRLAPLQIGSWGHPETTGLPTMDMYLSAAGFEPANAQDNYSERIVPLPNLGVYVEPLTPEATKPNLKSIGLRDDFVLLLCPGTPFKYMPAHDRVWTAIARGLPAKSKARLVFFRTARHSMGDMLEARLRQSFEREGVDFDSRVCIIPVLDRKRFFGLMQQSALMLDTLGFSGFNTALQGIECGLPVLAREGDFMRGRLASAIMRRMGIPELVATSDSMFVDLAIELASDASKRKELSRQIVRRRDVLFNDLEPIRALERCLAEAIMRNRAANRPL